MDSIQVAAHCHHVWKSDSHAIRSWKKHIFRKAWAWKINEWKWSKHLTKLILSDVLCFWFELSGLIVIIYTRSSPSQKLVILSFFFSLHYLKNWRRNIDSGAWQCCLTLILNVRKKYFVFILISLMIIWCKYQNKGYRSKIDMKLHHTGALLGINVITDFLSIS